MIVHPPHKVGIKAGSSVLQKPDGSPNTEVMHSIISELIDLKRKQHMKLFYASSGAVAFGRSMYPTYGEDLPCGDTEKEREKKELIRKQGWASLGQVSLIYEYMQLMKPRNMFPAQNLLEKMHFEIESSRETMTPPITMAFNDPNVIPIFNENDLTAIDELRFTDNDELTKYLCTLLNVDTAVFLTGGVNGVLDSKGKLIREIHPLDFDPKQLSFSGPSEAGKGGMESKLNIALELAKKGVQVFIARGTREGIIKSLFAGDTTIPFTYIHPVDGGGEG